MTLVKRRVDYRGSIDDYHGRYEIADESATGDDVRHALATFNGTVVLTNVRRTSFRLLPTGPKHQLVDRDKRVEDVQRALAEQHNRDEWSEDLRRHIDNLAQFVADLVQRNRPIEAEYWLLSAEAFAGIITPDQFQRRVNALVPAGDDESWMP